MSDAKAHGLILSVLKCVYLSEPRHSVGYCDFDAGRPGVFGFTSCRLTWWFGHEYLDAIQRLAWFLNENYSDSVFRVENEIIRSIEEALQLVCLDQDLFIDYYVPPRPKTLFNAARSGKHTLLAMRILDEAQSILNRSLQKVTAVYFLPGVTSPLICLPENNIYLVSHGDNLAISKLQEAGIAPQNFKEEVSVFSHTIRALAEDNSGSYLLINTEGTFDSVVESCDRVIRQFVAVMYSQVRVRTSSLHTTQTTDDGVLIQFANLGQSNECSSGSVIEPLIPELDSGEFTLSEQIARSIVDWYTNTAKLSENQKERKYLGASHINLALNESGDKAFIYYFLALDALFGVKGRVESSILEGVRSLDSGDQWEEKFSLIYRLRCEIFHGGKRKLEECPDHLRYRKHFRSDPVSDIELLCSISLLSFPQTAPK
ncbi:hypothetical protein GCM10008090_35130 [Arenicella chitinivorans]|uniref:Apea-like HEPN domain-containing protein n=1 Tax=Arenicella chitinivorans TaxID=1329800 RepID=A0A918S315_9GAMM|nr:hypothetical protein [Arenicella chitinivorans]GHA22288.1 hypothetical protein GCM10008090_35130 [Arenicella chitinivorans]